MRHSVIGAYTDQLSRCHSSTFSEMTLEAQPFSHSPMMFSSTGRRLGLRTMSACSASVALPWRAGEYTGSWCTVSGMLRMVG